MQRSQIGRASFDWAHWLARGRMTFHGPDLCGHCSIRDVVVHISRLLTARCSTGARYLPPAALSATGWVHKRLQSSQPNSGTSHAAVWGLDQATEGIVEAQLLPSATPTRPGNMPRSAPPAIIWVRDFGVPPSRLCSLRFLGTSGLVADVLEIVPFGSRGETARQISERPTTCVSQLPPAAHCAPGWAPKYRRALLAQGYDGARVLLYATSSPLLATKLWAAMLWPSAPAITLASDSVDSATGYGSVPDVRVNGVFQTFGKGMRVSIHSECAHTWDQPLGLKDFWTGRLSADLLDIVPVGDRGHIVRPIPERPTTCASQPPPAAHRASGWAPKHGRALLARGYDSARVFLCGTCSPLLATQVWVTIFRFRTPVNTRASDWVDSTSKRGSLPDVGIDVGLRSFEEGTLGSVPSGLAKRVAHSGLGECAHTWNQLSGTSIPCVRGFGVAPRRHCSLRIFWTGGLFTNLYAIVPLGDRGQIARQISERPTTCASQLPPVAHRASGWALNYCRANETPVGVSHRPCLFGANPCGRTLAVDCHPSCVALPLVPHGKLGQRSRGSGGARRQVVGGCNDGGAVRSGGTSPGHQTRGCRARCWASAPGRPRGGWQRRASCNTSAGGLRQSGLSAVAPSWTWCIAFRNVPVSVFLPEHIAPQPVSHGQPACALLGKAAQQGGPPRTSSSASPTRTACSRFAIQAIRETVPADSAGPRWLSWCHDAKPGKYRRTERSVRHRHLWAICLRRRLRRRHLRRCPQPAPASRARPQPTNRTLCRREKDCFGGVPRRTLVWQTQ